MKMIAVSNYIRDVIASNHGVKGIEVVPNSVDLDQFDAPPRAKNNPIRIGFLYTETERKNVRLAIDAVTEVKRRRPELEIVAFGTRPPNEPLPDFIRFIANPSQNEIPGLYASCDVWLLTSDHEGFGLPILEAMACRTPVLSTRAGAAPELIDGTNGTLLPGESKAFADEILRYAEMSPEEWHRRSDAAYESVRTYSWSMAADRFLEILGAT